MCGVSPYLKPGNNEHKPLEKEGQFDKTWNDTKFSEIHNSMI